MAFTLHEEGNVSILALDRPPLNLLGLDEVKALSAAFLAHDRAKPLVLTGAGSVFSAGVDAKAFAAYSPEQRVELAREITLMTARLLAIPGPVVAAVPGHAMGGGFVLPLCADYRLVAGRPDIRFGLTEARAGVPFPSGPSVIVRHEVPEPLLRFMTLSSGLIPLEDLISARIFDEQCAPEELTGLAVERAKTLASQPAFAAVKWQMRGQMAEAVRACADTGEEWGFT